MKKVIFILIIIALVAAGMMFFQPRLKTVNNKSLTATCIKRDISVELNLIGVLDAEKSHMISSTTRDANGKIVYLIDDGTHVKKGDVLIKLDQGPYENQVEKLKSEVASLEAAVMAGEQSVNFEKNQVDREISTAKYNQNVAELEYKRLKDGDGPLKVSALQEEKDQANLELQRYESFYNDLITLREEGFDNTSEILSVKEKVKVYRDKYNTASERYLNYKKHVLPALLESALAKKENTMLQVDQTIQGGHHKIAKAGATLLQIKSKLQATNSSFLQAKDELLKTIVYAPFDGIVIHYETYRDGQKRKPRVGDSVFPNQPILYLPDISKMVVKSEAREIDLHKLALDQKGMVRVDAYPTQLITGKLSFIGALATSSEEKSTEEKFFQIVFSLDDKNTKLRPGMTCRITIQSKFVEDVLSVPIQTVFEKNGRTFCFVKNGLLGYEKREVKTALQNEDYIQILSGLNENEEVSLTYHSNL